MACPCPEGKVILQNTAQHEQRVLLILTPDESVWNMLVGVLGPSAGGAAPGPEKRSGDIRVCGRGLVKALDVCCVNISSLAQLRMVDLEKCVAVVSSLVLPDGTGIDAMNHVQNVRPEVGVILVGGAESDEAGLQALSAGAADYLPLQEPYLRAFRHAVIRAIAQQRVRLENQRLHQKLSLSVAELALANEQLQQVIMQLEHAVRTDELTGLSNRRWLSLRLETEWAEASRFGLPLAFMMIDLDGFKQLNDALGHQHGDEMLRLAGRVIRANCREVDVVARYGGDEFCVLMTNTPAEEAMQVAQRILGACGQVRGQGGRQPGLMMSIGLSHNMVSSPANSDQLVQHADVALYAAKWAGKSRAMLYSPNDTHLRAEPLGKTA